ncbi:protein-N(pi)-phosphohistidine--sugar phosphotransferase [Izhakiella australiensis]|uniref:PTS system glucose-specific EIICB component n=1 Tax=Izhakiella australiensis TaxID=1926881 RepID=A0A1S8YNC6_9GAMM|nr:PTS transporter subunit EIIC [Izhakiella australiensis]OON40297.1 protein-N(pi)-phosphohistidine--sugar phosphotransferase [Izhakiella australiensis]
MSKYTEMSELAIKYLGGVENIVHITHCATRLRINVKENNSVDIEGLKKLPNSAGVVRNQEQVQIIIGPNVDDAYNEIIAISRWSEIGNKEKESSKEKSGPRNFSWYVNKFANFVAPMFMPVVPAMIVGGMILSIRNLLVNYVGMDVNGGTANVLLAIFQAGFVFLPVYLGYTLASQLKMQPIMGAFLGAVLLTERINNVSGLSFAGISIPQIEYGATILPVILGVFFMYYVEKLLKKIIPEFLIYFAKPLLTMVICVPILLIIIGPLGTRASGAIGDFCIWLGDTVGFLSQPILSAAYPYMVMLGIDKALVAIGVHLVATVGYDSVTGSMGFISNLCIGASALAVATTSKVDKAQKGMYSSFGITALCGVTEPAFYGCLISRPRVLIGTALGAISGGIVAGLLGLRAYIIGGCPGLLTFLYFVDDKGNLHYVFIAAIVAAVSIIVSFTATKMILTLDERRAAKKNRVQMQQPL